MWRILFIAILWFALATGLRAQETEWQACRVEAGAAVPVLYDCHPVGDVIDPQGREIWLRSVVQRPKGDGPVALYVVGAASSEVWLNAQKLGANGRPGASPEMERAGRYEAAFPIPEHMWRSEANAVVVRMSSFHGVIRLDGPIAAITVAPYPWPSRTIPVAITFLIAGALFAAAFGFGVIYSLRRSGSSLALAGMAGVAGLQAVFESMRALIPYAYPVHGLRLVGIWVLTTAFAILLVSYVVSRFWPQARRRFVGLTILALAATWFAHGFDLKTAVALMVGLALATVAAVFGVRHRLPGARLTLAYLTAFMAIGLMFPRWLVDLSYFLFAAGFVLPLLMAEVVRLGRDDQKREVALTREVARPDCLTVASSRGVERVPLDDIVAVVGADDYVELRLTNGRKILHSARLDRLEADLSAGFLRVHRSAIANLAHVRALERDGGRARLQMNESISLPVSRNRLASVRSAIDGN